MRRVRLHVARVAVVWLLSHVCLLVTVPTVLCASMEAAAAAACTCDHADGQMCPMHHTRTTGKRGASESHPCSCRSTADPMAGLATALIGPPGLIVPSTVPTAPVATQAESRAIAPAPYDSFVPPDSPPPRG